jgi:GAF domain-containing protein
MMNTNLSNSQSTNPEEATRQLYKNWREGFAIPLLLGVLIFGAIALGPAIISSESIIIDVIFISTYVITGIVTIVRFSYIVRMSVFLLGIYVLGLSELITHGILGDSLFFFLGLIIFSTILLSPRAGIIAIITDIITFILFGLLVLNEQIILLNPNAPPSKIEDWFTAGAVIIMFGVVIIIGFQRLEKQFLEAQVQIEASLSALKDERTNLENKVADRTRQLRKVNEIGRIVTSILDPDELLVRASHLIETEFECYYTAFFLLDITTGQWAELKEATGEAGRVLRENRYRLDVDGKSLVAAAIRTKQVRIAVDTGTESVRFDNPLLPYTRSQIAIPLIVGENVFGALEMHSTKENEFSPQDVDAYQNMANEVAIALENSRLFREAQQSLTEMRATQRQYLQGAWSSLTAEQNLEYSLGDNDSANNKEIEIPLALRDQVIGQIRLESLSEWTHDQKNLIEAVATQATLALENARLVEESQSIAARERLANELIAKVWASTNMDNILQTTARELGRTLEAAEVTIEVSMDDKDEK